MRELVAVISMFVLCGLGCTVTQTGPTLCDSIVPDGGATNLACDVAWSCSNDTAHYELQCSLVEGNFRCACVTEGTTGKSFTVNPFTCTNVGAAPAASEAAGCGWTLM